MTKQEAIRWLKEYIEQEDLVYQCGKGLEKRKKEISEYSKPFIEEKKAGVWGSVGTGLVVAVVGAIPCAIASCVILMLSCVVALIIDSSTLLEKTIAIIEKAAGIVFQDVTDYFSRHIILGPTISYLIIGLGFSCILGVLAFIFVLSSDKDVPEKNRKKKEEYDKRQAELPKVQLLYDLTLKSKNEAECKLKRMEKNSPIPSKYLAYADELWELLTSGRADTLKEALNLLHQHWYEEERLHELRRHHQAVEEENKQIRAELRRNAEASQRAADAAEEAADWERRKYIDDIFDDLLK